MQIKWMKERDGESELNNNNDDNVIVVCGRFQWQMSANHMVLGK